MFIEQSLQILKDNHQKLTKTRLRILEQLAHIQNPLNPYKLGKQNSNKDIDITTIYRNLELFESLGIVHRIQSLGGYIPCLHHHTNCHKVHDLIICNNCNRINETHIDPSMKELLGLGNGPIELNGYCKSCEQKK